MCLHPMRSRGLGAKSGLVKIHPDTPDAIAGARQPPKSLIGWLVTTRPMPTITPS
jgi:hypothetical protein